MVARGAPWWVTLLLGVACVALGAVVTAELSFSLSLLRWLVGAALVLAGLSELALAESSPRPWLSRVVAAIWILCGVVAVSQPETTIRALAIVVGVGLVSGGAVKVYSAFLGDGDERFVVGLSGITNVVVGGLALSWPGVTVLVVAVLFGIRTVLFGVGQIALAIRLRGARPGEPVAQRRWPRSVRLVGTAAVLLIAMTGAVISAKVGRAPAAPGAFYSAPSPLPSAPPGTIIRSEVIDGFRAGATAYRVLYTSTGYDGRPTAVSGFIVVPDGPAPAAGRRVLAYTHGTVGVASNCAPSLVTRQDQQPLFVEGGAAFLAAGYVIAASDYQGLGTPGPHPYLVGSSEAMNELDIVRAARNLTAARAGSDFAVWGHSQGGHAALFTGQLAADYAPELRLVGVAAGGPVPDFTDLFNANVDNTIGRVLISMTLQSWSEVYDGARLQQIVTPAARPIVTRIARNCLYDSNQILASVPGAVGLGRTFLSSLPQKTEPWKTIAERNTPGNAPTNAPLLIAQGAADTIVDPAVTKRLVDKLCRNGETVEYRLAPGVGHLKTGQEAAPAVLRWINDRFAGKPAPTSCAMKSNE